MKNLKGACIFGQSGGPTSVINASAAGVFLEALKQENITEIYGAEHGIRGILEEKFFDIRKEDVHELELLKNTPSSELGSVRYKLKDVSVDDTDYKRLLEVFKKYNIRYFFYNGGNDSMDTCNKISKFLQSVKYECNVIGVPKTIDNDLATTDHCPGYGSAARYVATTCMEVYKDMSVYDTPLICVIEVMGRNAGWLTAASKLASVGGFGPDLIYLPEKDFDIDKFLNDVKALKEKKNHVMVCVSEGIHDKNGKLIAESFNDVSHDSFGHAQLGGVASGLGNLLKEKLGCKVRSIEFSLMQRCGAHVGSGRDIEEAFNAGSEAVKAACRGETDKMVCFKRTKEDYAIEYILLDVALAANAEKKVPLEWINEEGNDVKDEFVKYALPLIQGDPKFPLENNLPRFARLKKVYVK
ncbi:MAG: 6-phosphofructokinase [Bacilli bacterium]|nr:6-phosphofructokinase [Bacilli bacterium]